MSIVNKNTKKFMSGLRYLRNLIFLDFHHYGWKIVFGKNVNILNPNYIYIGNSVNIDENCSINAITDHQYTYSKQTKPVIKIEDNVGVGKGSILYAICSIHIKKNVMLGPYCFISDYDHEYEDVNKNIVHQPLTNIKPILIKKGAWLGARVTVLSGVTIGEHTVIGAGSVVTRDIPNYSVAVGVPAKVIKQYNFKTKKWERA